MEYKKENTINTILTILAILIPTIIFFISSPEKITPITYIIFIGIIVVTLIFSIYAIINSEWKKMKENIKKNGISIVEIRKSLKDEKAYYDMEKRISILEAIKNKRGQIDPKILWWVLIGILLYLFLKSIGIF